MKVIYANTRVKGLDGVYANPAGFNGELIAEATEVVTIDEKIAEAYDAADVEVVEFTEEQKNVLFPKVTTEKVFNLEDALENIDSLKADDVKKVAKALEIDYINKDETVAAIKEDQGIE